MSVTTPAVDRVLIANEKTSVQLVLQVSTQGMARKIRLRHLRLKWVSGDVAGGAIRPRIYSATGEAADGLNQKFRMAAATAAYDTLVAENMDQIVWTDVNGRLFLNFDAVTPSATAMYSGELVYEVLA